MHTKDKKSTNRQCDFTVAEKELAERLGIDARTEEYFAERYKDSITKIKKVGDRTEYYQPSKTGEYQTITVWYTISSGELVIRVEEEYKLKGLEGQIGSEDKPISITMEGTKDNMFFSIKLTKFTEKPTVEWLSQFSIEDYKG
jgi:hypothetical protein